MTAVAPELHDGRAFIAGIAVSELAARHGTPLYVLDGGIVSANLRRIQEAFAQMPVSVFYSCKANPSVGLLRRLRANGVGLDACSPGDLAFAAAAGFTGGEISFTGHAVADDELRAVVEADAGFTADSLSQVDRFGRLAPRREIGLRLNCGIDAGFHAHVRAGAFESKFGVHRPQVEEAITLAGRHELRIAGLHGHLGSGVTGHTPYLALLDALLEVGEALPDLKWINLGGGWADEGDDGFDLRGFAGNVQARLDALERPLELRLEPGGFLVLNAGCLLTRVTEIKPSVRVGDRTTPAFVGTDMSHNHLVSSVIYGAQHPIWVANRADAAPTARFDVVGNLMQAGDVIAKNRSLPPPELGDVLVIGGCGGYAAWRAPNFNERPRPAEILVEGQTVTLLRRAETEADLLALEAV